MSTKGAKIVDKCNVGMVTTRVEVSSVEALLNYKPEKDELTTVVAVDCNQKVADAIKEYCDALDYGFVDGTCTKNGRKENSTSGSATKETDVDEKTE